MPAYYNEHDPKAAAWLRELIKAGLIADGEVDERSITDVTADDVRGFRQCHFFAGIGGWSYALRLAGWPDDRAVWSGSCPCQPFSSAGKGIGGDDPRHLWPAWFRLIRECRPIVVFGEQVESAIAHGWIDAVFDDLEAEAYAAWAVGIPAACVGAPHIRQRLWFVADNISIGRERRSDSEKPAGENSAERSEGLSDVECDGLAGFVADASGDERGPGRRCSAMEGRAEPQWPAEQSAGLCDGRLADSGRERREWQRLRIWERGSLGDNSEIGRSGETCVGVGDSDSQRETTVGGVSGWALTERERSPWAGAEWIQCRDGKQRPVEPGTFPLAHGVPARVGRLRGYGNAIVPQVAAEVDRRLYGPLSRG